MYNIFDYIIYCPNNSFFNTKVTLKCNTEYVSSVSCYTTDRNSDDTSNMNTIINNLKVIYLLTALHVCLSGSRT